VIGVVLAGIEMNGELLWRRLTSTNAGTRAGYRRDINTFMRWQARRLSSVHLTAVTGHSV
jgi:hypothetical protein